MLSSTEEAKKVFDNRNSSDIRGDKVYALFPNSPIPHSNEDLDEKFERLNQAAKTTAEERKRGLLRSKHLAELDENEQ